MKAADSLATAVDTAMTIKNERFRVEMKSWLWLKGKSVRYSVSY